MSEEKRANIRNNTTEFLIFTGQSGKTVLMGTLFDVSVPTINEHLSNLQTTILSHKFLLEKIFLKRS